MRHLSEEQLVLFLYEEPVDREAVQKHLADCERCRSEYNELRRALAAVDGLQVPDRGEAYGREVWQRIAPRLEDRPPAGSPWWLLPRRLALAGAMAALLLMAFLAGRYWSGDRIDVAQPAPEQVRERILLVAVSEHLERSQMVLVELINAPANGEVDISHEQQWARDLVDSNRLYRQTAAQAGESSLASVLDELERTLLQIAHSPVQLSSRELEDIRRRIEAQGILFKIRVVGTQVKERERKNNPAIDIEQIQSRRRRT